MGVPGLGHRRSFRLLRISARQVGGSRPQTSPPRFPVAALCQRRFLTDGHPSSVTDRRYSRPCPAGKRFAHQPGGFGDTAHGDGVDGIVACIWLVPLCDGVAYNALPTKERLWDKYYTAAPARQRRCVERYNIVKRA